MTAESIQHTNHRRTLQWCCLLSPAFLAPRKAQSLLLLLLLLFLSTKQHYTTHSKLETEIEFKIEPELKTETITAIVLCAVYSDAATASVDDADDAAAVARSDVNDILRAVFPPAPNCVHTIAIG